MFSATVSTTYLVSVTTRCCALCRSCSSGFKNGGSQDLPGIRRSAVPRAARAWGSFLANNRLPGWTPTTESFPVNTCSLHNHLPRQQEPTTLPLKAPVCVRRASWLLYCKIISHWVLLGIFCLCSASKLAPPLQDNNLGSGILGFVGSS